MNWSDHLRGAEMKNEGVKLCFLIISLTELFDFLSYVMYYLDKINCTF